MEQIIEQKPKKIDIFLENLKSYGWKVVLGILVVYTVFFCYVAFSPEVSTKGAGQVRQETAVKVFYENNKSTAQQKLIDEASKLTPSHNKEQLFEALSDFYDINTIDGYKAVQKAIWEKQSEDTEKSLKVLEQKNRVRRQAGILWDTFVDVNNKGAGLLYNVIYYWNS